MGTLTKNERDGLEDAFLSIHSSLDKYEKFKNILFLIFKKIDNIKIENSLKVANYGLKETNKSHFSSKFGKKKKNLSK